MGSTTTVGGGGGKTLTADDWIVFRMGGSYRLCYTANGTFGVDQADVTPVKIDVNGVFDKSAECDTVVCMTHHRFDCYLSKQSYTTEDGRYGLTTSCQVDYSYPNAGYFGILGKTTWTSEFTSVVTEPAGTVDSATVKPMPCTSEPASFICSDGGACDAGDTFVTPVTYAGGGIRTYIPTTRGDLVSTISPEQPKFFRPRTVAACYCPARGDCDEKEEFLQQIGIMHFYLSKVCHTDDPNCLLDYSGVVSQYKFRIRVECPTDACGYNRDSRVKLVEYDSNNDRPKWDSLNGCRTGLHGMIGPNDRLLNFTYVPIDGSAPGTVNPYNCGDALHCYMPPTLARQDYKEFGGTGHFGFQWTMGTTNHEHRNFHTTKIIDVCYCNGDCTVAAGWFKVGSLRLSPTRLVSSATSRSNLPAQWNIEFVNQPGIVALYRSYADADVLGLQENGLLKIVADT
jgi:hypothetical protein